MNMMTRPLESPRFQAVSTPASVPCFPVAFPPADKFLSANFVADETNPSFVVGPVKAFAASRKCPTAWLYEADRKPPAEAAGKEIPMEYTAYLEEDCPHKIVYYVFIDQRGLTPQQWIEWRQRFQKNKTEEEYGSTKSKLEKACVAGCGCNADLRFIQINGQLLNKSPEKYLRTGGRFVPLYDLNLQKKLSR
jgi:hypothetical protein|uniref:Uncharacterized protein n=1 Tax=Desulfobacca acetoxidans TaxID=60893 RepID=A0A7V6A240_9BACT